MGWFNKTMEWVGKAMPNELSKLNSWSDELAYIPYVGAALSGIMKAGSTVDNAATSYNDLRDRGASQGEAWSTGINSGMKGVQSKSWDPGYYGSPGGNINRDWANVIGQVGHNISFGKDNINVNANPDDYLNNPYFNKGAKKRVEQGIPQKYNFGTQLGLGSVGYSKSGGMDYSNLFRQGGNGSNIMGMLGNSNNSQGGNALGSLSQLFNKGNAQNANVQVNNKNLTNVVSLLALLEALFGNDKKSEEQEFIPQQLLSRNQSYTPTLTYARQPLL